MGNGRRRAITMIMVRWCDDGDDGRWAVVVVVVVGDGRAMMTRCCGAGGGDGAGDYGGGGVDGPVGVDDGRCGRTR